MEYKFVFALLLVIKLTGAFGFYIKGTEENNKSDAYKVTEDETTHSFTFINPKLEKQTRREIVFYHVIETPYNQDNRINEGISDDANVLVGNDHDLVAKNHEDANDMNVVANDHVIETPYNQDNRINEGISDDANVLVGNDHDLVAKNHEDANDMNVVANDREITGNDPIIDSSIPSKEHAIYNDDNADTEYKADDDKDNKPEVQIEGLDDDRRTVTNGHGYQFFNNGLEQGSDADPTEQINNKSESVDKSETVDDPIPEETTNEETPVSIYLLDSTEAVLDLDSIYPDSPESKIQNNLDEIDSVETTEEDISPAANETISKELNTTDDHIDQEVYGKIAVPEPVDSIVKGEISENNGDKGSLDTMRRKRELNYFKEQSSLPGLNLDAQPDYMKAIITTEKPSAISTGLLENKSRDKFKNQIEEIANKVDEIAEREERSVRQAGKTYGMRLTGDNGLVWNDFNDKKVSYDIGVTNSEVRESKMAPSRDEEKINKMIDDFENWKNKNTSNIEKSSNEDIYLEEASKEDNNFEEPPQEHNKLEEISNENNIDLETKDLPTEETTTENLSHQAKTYGMRLAGDNGIAWNDLNGQRASYFVEANKDNFIEEPSKEDNNVLIEPINKEDNKLEEKNEDIDLIETSNEKNDSEDTTEDQTTEGATTEEQRRPKTYGMSLAGDHGIVWNDLNGQRVSYQVGEPNEETEKQTASNYVTETTTLKPDSDKALENTREPSENNKESSKPDEIGNVLNKTDAQENKNQLNINKITKEILDIIKEVFQKETAKLESTKNNNKNPANNKDNNSTDYFEADQNENSASISTTAAPLTENVNENNDNTNVGTEHKNEENETPSQEQFWKWLDDWTKFYVEQLMNRIDNQIKDEVAKQIKEHFANHTHTEQGNNNDQDTSAGNKETSYSKNNATADNINDNAELGQAVNGNEDELTAKKRKDKDCEDRNSKKEGPVKIEATTVYGNSVGNKNVTNIFIFNVGKKTDLDNIQLLNNGTNGIYLFGNDDKNSDQINGDNVVENKDADEIQIPEKSNDNISSSAQLDYSENIEMATEKETTIPDTVVLNNTLEHSKESVESFTDAPEHEEAIESENNSKDKEIAKPDSEESIIEITPESNKDEESEKIPSESAEINKEIAKPDSEESKIEITPDSNKDEESGKIPSESTEINKETTKPDSEESKIETTPDSNKDEESEKIPSESTEINNEIAKPDSEESKIEITPDSNIDIESEKIPSESAEINNTKEVESAVVKLGSNEDVTSYTEIDKDEEAVLSESADSSTAIKDSVDEIPNSSETVASNSMADNNNEIDKSESSKTNISKDSSVQEKVTSNETRDKNEEEKDANKQGKEVDGSESKKSEEINPEDKTAVVVNGEEKEESDTSGGEENKVK